jgi:oxalate decarboxylase/phosphoglucose isomerase-like protein (cupin superfamily)
MKDEMEKYSHPTGVTPTKFGRVFQMEVRANPEKPGRSLTVTWDERFPLVEGFKNRYSYLVRFGEPGSQAGNHYHKVKHELYVAVNGEMTVTLENMDTKEQEHIEISEEQAEFVEVKPTIAHSVTAKTPGCILLVVSTSPETEHDEFKYQLA